MRRGLNESREGKKMMGYTNENPGDTGLTSVGWCLRCRGGGKMWRGLNEPREGKI